jgi:hypothetical protein
VERNQIKYFVLKLDHFKCILSEPHELYAWAEFWHPWFIMC